MNRWLNSGIGWPTTGITSVCPGPNVAKYAGSPATEVATAQIAPDFLYEGLAESYALDPDTQAFLKQSNPWALNAIAARLLEASDRGMWDAPKPETLDGLREVLLESETLLEARGEKARKPV